MWNASFSSIGLVTNLQSPCAYLLLEALHPLDPPCCSFPVLFDYPLALQPGKDRNLDRSHPCSSKYAIIGPGFEDFFYFFED